MATLHTYVFWSSDMKHCRSSSDCNLACCSPLSFVSSSTSSASFTSASSSPSSLAKCCHARSMRTQVRITPEILHIPDYYHIPYTEGVPVGPKLKLSNLPLNCDREALVGFFRSCDAVVKSLEITNDDEEGNAFGYATLEDLNQASAAVAQLDGSNFQGKCLRMDFVERRPYDNRRLNKIRSRHRAAPKNKVYIGNLPWRVDNITLEQLFSIYGTVQKAEIACDRLNGRSLGYGFVIMSNAAEAQKAIAALDGCEVEGRLLKVNVALARTPSHV